jgi:SSS family solute:Na+ symporter
MLAVQFLSIATFLRFYISIDFDVAIMVGAGAVAIISTVFYSAFGGFTRDMWTDVIQMAFITLGVGAILAAESSDSGLRPELAKLPPEFFTVGRNGILFFVGSLFFVAPTFLLRFDLWQRILTAKTDGVAKSAFITSGVIAFFFFAFFGLLGMYGKALGIKDEQFVALEVIQQKLTGL